MADVLELTHARPSDQVQSALFRYLLDRRHDRADVTVPASLPMLAAHAELQALPVEARRALVEAAAAGEPEAAGRLAGARLTWEAVSGWLDGPLDAAAWTAVIPSMRYMALLRNLRNFDQAGVSDAVAEQVAAKLSDPEQVARSRQFPYTFSLLNLLESRTSAGWPF